MLDEHNVTSSNSTEKMNDVLFADIPIYGASRFTLNSPRPVNPEKSYLSHIRFHRYIE